MKQKKMRFILHTFLLIIIGFLGCEKQKASSKYESENLKVEQLTRNSFRHITYLTTESFGKVSCNGMIVIDNGEALVFDTPTNNNDSKELINWIEDSLKCEVIGVVLTHFHSDCLGSLDEFHRRQIPSYASFKTIKSAKIETSKVPQIGFKDYLEVKIGDEKVINEFLGEGHTRDNIVSYFPSEKALFGGCLVKSVGAHRGFLGDANVSEWSSTVKAVKAKYKNVEVVVPGHGKPGDITLLDYTINLFSHESENL